jgi:uncharacterized protein YdeI (BOF family)
MKKQLCSLLSLSTLALLLGVGLSLNAQQDPQRPGQQPDAQQQPSSQPEATPKPSDNPADNTAASQTGSTQTFTGTIMKSGDKFVLRDAGGTSYDVDKQDAVKPFEGKKVNIRGTLDSNGKMIHVQ